MTTLPDKEKNLPTPETGPDDKKLHLKMSAFVYNLLIHDFDKLCHLIYRHDVNEEKFRNAIQHPDVEKQASQIADLIIEREKEKIITRKAYQKYKQNRDKYLPE